MYAFSLKREGGSSNKDRGRREERERNLLSASAALSVCSGQGCVRLELETRSRLPPWVAGTQLCCPNMCISRELDLGVKLKLEPRYFDIRHRHPDQASLAARSNAWPTCVILRQGSTNFAQHSLEITKEQFVSMVLCVSKYLSCNLIY